MRLVIGFFVSFYFHWASGICTNWSLPSQEGYVEDSRLSEASGIEVPDSNRARLYHINDSGDGPYFYQTSRQGVDFRKIEILDFEPRDTEDLSWGPCGNLKCLFVGDIGDNKRRRESIQIVLIEEQAEFANRVRPYHLLELLYPDRPQNAEGLAVHPNGDLYILTKEKRRARVYVVRANQVFETRVTMEYLGEIPLTLSGGEEERKSKATSFDISADGKSFVVLTKKYALSFVGDLSEGIPSRSPTRIPIQRLPQAEAIAFLDSNRQIIYSSERKKMSQTPLIRQDCGG